MVHAAVEYKLHGESGLKSVMDPFGNGPFGFQRFVFKGVDRGFELKSAYAGADAPFVMIFVEKARTGIPNHRAGCGKGDRQMTRPIAGWNYSGFSVRIEMCPA